VSMGVTCAAGDRNANVEALLNEADLALYRAKKMAEIALKHIECGESKGTRERNAEVTCVEY